MLDENRAVVVESGLLSNNLRNLFRDGTLLPFVIPVIYNVCVDYGKTQLHKIAA